MSLSLNRAKMISEAVHQIANNAIFFDNLESEIRQATGQ